MKKILILLSFILSFNLFNAQNNEPINFTEVVKVDSTRASKELFLNAKMWFSETYKNPKEVLNIDDKENKILAGKGVFKYETSIFMSSVPREGWITYDFNISCKDGRYKYEFKNFYHQGKSISLGLITNEDVLSSLDGPTAWKKKVTSEVQTQIRNKMQLLISSLKQNMNKSNVINEDW